MTIATLAGPAISHFQVIRLLRQFNRRKRVMTRSLATLLFLYSFSANAAVDPAHIVLHSVSGEDRLAVLSWPEQEMIAVGIDDKVGDQLVITEITSGKVILSNTLTGDRYLIDSNDTRLVTRRRQDSKTPSPIAPSTR